MPMPTFFLAPAPHLPTLRAAVNASSVLELVFEFIVIFALVLANGFFVAAEFALVKVRASQLQPMLKDGANWRVAFTIKATEHLDAVLSATQLGITLASLALGWVGEPFVAKRLTAPLHYLGITDPAVVSSIAFALAFSVITFFHIVLGELAPKSLAIQRAKTVSLWTAPPLLLFHRLFYPFIYLLNGAANLMLRAFGLHSADTQEHDFSADELEYVLKHSPDRSPASLFTNRLMFQTSRARTTTARQIMIPRLNVKILDLGKDLKTNLKTARDSVRSRYPVCAPNGEVRGLLLIREWLWQIQTLGEDCDFKPLIRPIVEFKLGATVPEMVEQFRAARCHMAVVLDENKKFVGIVTFEDVLEEIIGDIRDELDRGRRLVFAIDNKEHMTEVNGELHMRDLEVETAWTFDAGPLETVESWILRQCSVFPRTGETLEIGEWHITVLDSDGTRITRARIERRPSEEEAEAEAAATAAATAKPPLPATGRRL
jgi:CBS domain containing-hemolysin-like protein